MSGLLLACIFIVILTLGVVGAAISGVDLFKGDANTALCGGLKMFVMLSILAGIRASCAFTEDGFVGALKNLVHGRYSLFFLDNLSRPDDCSGRPRAGMAKEVA